MINKQIQCKQRTIWQLPTYREREQPQTQTQMMTRSQRKYKKRRTFQIQNRINQFKQKECRQTERIQSQDQIIKCKSKKHRQTVCQNIQIDQKITKDKSKEKKIQKQTSTPMIINNDLQEEGMFFFSIEENIIGVNKEKCTIIAEQIEVESEQIPIQKEAKNQSNCPTLSTENMAKQGPPFGNNIKQPPSGTWTSKPSCMLLVTILEGWTIELFKVYNPTNTNKDSLQQQKKEIQKVDQYTAYRRESQLSDMSHKNRITIIQQILKQCFENKFEFENQVVIFFFRLDRNKKNPEEEKTDILSNLINPYIRMVLSKVYQLLSLKFFKELVQLQEYRQNNIQIKTIAERLLQEAEFTPQVNTIIQFFFLRYCYDRADEIQNNVKEFFDGWKLNEKNIIINEIVRFINSILVEIEKIHPEPEHHQ